jgi:ABC-type amino acid transport substrate-binding protein
MTEVTLHEFVGSRTYPFIAGSAPDRFARQLAALVPNWRIDVPEADDADLWMAATPPGGRGGAAITADRPGPEGYRDIDEWTVDGSGALSARLTLYHGDGPEKFDAAIRVLRAVEALPPEPIKDVPAQAGQERRNTMRVKGMDVDLSDATWTKSSRSGAAGHCVEVAFVGQATAVRDSKNPDAGTQFYTPEEWNAFLEGVKAGEFDRG